VVYLAIDVLLAFLRPHYSLLSNAESDYGRGKDAWLMDVNFVLRGLVSAAVALVLSKSRPLLRRWPIWLIGVWAACSALLALFPDNPPGLPAHPSGKVHLALAAIAFSAVIVATVALTLQMSAPIWRSLRPVFVVLVSLGALSYLALPKTLNRAHGVGGLIERIFLGSQLAWLSVAMARLVLPQRLKNQGTRRPADDRSR
jgi:hypothetical membrane protein